LAGVRARPRPITLGLVIVGLLALPAGAAAAGSDGAGGQGDSAAAERLAQTYAPVTMVREQQDPPCDTAAEQYEPTDVGTVLGNPAVTLTRFVEGEGTEDLKRAPSAADVAGLGGDYYLDLPGKVLGDTCDYARDFAKLRAAGRAPPIAYAHIAREAGHPGFVLQYWFFWYFNQFNDLHEADWEGMQLAFEAEDPAAALEAGEEPAEMILFQHAGGERAAWSDAKVEKQGRHPVVYPAAGSHATFYESAVYIENGQHGSGVGCDNTSEPVRELRPTPVLLPGEASTSGRFRWLSFAGHWGERERGFNNGPTGPITKHQWHEPFSWMAKQRSTSPRLPGGSVVGPTVTGAFCGTVTAVTDFMHLATRSAPTAAAALAGLFLLLVLPLALTSWGPIDLERLRGRRSFGQLVRGARRFYGRHWRVLVAVGLSAFPVVGGASMLAGLVTGWRAVDDVFGRNGVDLAIADALESVSRPIASAIVAAAVIVFVRELAQGRAIGFADSYRGTWARFRRVVSAQLLATAATLLLAATVIGLPFAIWKYVSWGFVQQEVLFTDKSIRESFRGSSELVRGRWWHTLRVAGFLWAVGLVTGPLLGFALIFTAFPLVLINVIGSVVFALLIPYVAVGRTLLYFDLQARAEEEPARSRRPWLPRLPKRVGLRREAARLQ
jgi:hypothetical protein